MHEDWHEGAGRQRRKGREEDSQKRLKKAEEKEVRFKQTLRALPDGVVLMSPELGDSVA